MKEDTKSELNTIAPMLKLSNILAAFPPYSFRSKIKRTPAAYKAYNIIIILLLTFLSGYQIYGKLTYEGFQSLMPTVRLTDYVSNSILIAFSWRTSTLTLLKSDQLKSFLFNLEQFDRTVKQYRRRKYLFLLVFLFLNVCSLISIVADSIAFGLSFGKETYKYFMAKNFMYYYFCATVIMIFWFGIEIQFRFKALNRLLLETSTSLKNDVFYLKSKHESGTKPEYQVLKKIAARHNDLCDIADQYNELFGVSLLLFVLYDIANILNNVVQILVTAVFNRSEDENTLLGYMVVMNVCWICTSLTRTVAVAGTSDRLENEASKTTVICYKMLNEVSNVPETDYEKELKEQLLHIAQQSSYRRPCVSAAGFFDINLEMMGFIMTSITTYIIVIIEFVSK